MFGRLQLGADDIITILRRDGTIIMRTPFDLDVIGKNISTAPGVDRVLSDLEGSPQFRDDDYRLASASLLVHVADAVCMTLGVGLGLDGLAYTLQPEALARLGLTAEDFEAVAGQTCDTLAEAGSLF